ncbi:TonB-dependent receptor [Kineobactrum salinum]|uniref:TonB-dependent receptor n=1 Tax=Kineobactrum salinum TaxID=2708301 RepID=A0A6C0U157_9GAMM|nr:TonB-dependent receptor [Kineobactrum salinum]QIB65299.1 TonB-dependent receptor [Kineobactrum salinum]
MRKALLGKAVLATLIPAIHAQAWGAGLVIEEVVVTAQKRLESIQDIPVAASAFTAAGLRERGLADPQDLSRATPNLDIFSAFGETAPKVTIRGIGSSSFNQNTESTAVIYLDEFPLNPTPAKLPQFFDLERVEILRGPQGTLYGKNTTGGAINLITRRPSGATGGHLTLTAGKYGQLDAEGAFETALAGDWSLRVAGRSQHRDGYGTNLANGEDIYDKEALAARVGLLYEGAQLTSYLKAWVHKSGADGYYIKTRQTDFAGNPAPANPITGAVTVAPDDPYRGAWNEAHNEVENRGLNANIDYDLGAHTLSLVTGYLESDNHNDTDCDGTDSELCRIDYVLEAEEFSAELRLASNLDGPFNYIAGLSYFREQLDIDNFYNLIFGTAQFTQAGEQTATAAAIFADGSYQLSDRLELLGGIRWTRDEKEIRFAGHTVAASPFLIDDSETWTEPGYRAGLSWSAAEDATLYATYSHGYRSGAYDTGLISDPTAQGVATDPEFVDNYELGLKSFWLDRRLQLNAALFYMEFTDQQLLVVRPGSLCCSQDNAGESEIRGLELEGQWLATQALTIGYAATWLDAEYTQWDKDGRDLAGQALPNAPEYQLSLSPEYAVPAWEGEVFVAVDYSYVGETRVGNDFDRLERDIQGSHSLVDARLGYRGETYDLLLWGKNLGDKAILRDYLDLSSFGFVQTLYGEPRSYGITLNYRF